MIFVYESLLVFALSGRILEEETETASLEGIGLAEGANVGDEAPEGGAPGPHFELSLGSS